MLEYWKNGSWDTALLGKWSALGGTIKFKMDNILCREDADIFPELISQVLRDGHKVRFCAPGNSMQPAIIDGDCLMVEPIGPAAIKIGNIILYQAEDRIIAHRVMDIGKCEIPKTQPAALVTNYSFILRGDAAYSYDEPVYPDQILGKVITVERNGRSINPYSIAYKLTCLARVWGSRLKRLIHYGYSI